MRNYGGHAPPQGYLVRPAGNSKVIKWVLVVIGALLFLTAGFVTLYIIGIATGPSALMSGILLGTLPVPFYALLILWIDRYESEPLWMLALSFSWGATFAPFLAIVFNSLIGKLVAEAHGRAAGEYYALVFSAPVVEEVSKAIVLFMLFWWKKDEFDGIIDGIVYAGMVGLGFAMTENFKYYGEAAIFGGPRLTGTFILRGAISPFAHPLFTGMTGIGLGLSRLVRNGAAKALLPALGLLTAITLHFTWNRSAASGSEVFFLVYLLVMMPVFAGAIISIVYALKREQRILREHLWYDCQRGLFSLQDYYCLCEIRGRLSASYRALRLGGYRLWRVRMRYNQTASELAFHRSRVVRGMVEDPTTAREREMAYVRQMVELRRQLGHL